MIEIIIPGEPVAKGRPRMRVADMKGAKRAVAYTPSKTRRYEDLVKLAAAEAMGERDPMEGPVVAVILAYLQIPASWSKKRQRLAELGEIAPAKRPDVENLVKSALDGCNKIVFRDDSQVCELRAVKAYSRRPRLEIRIAPLEDAG